MRRDRLRAIFGGVAGAGLGLSAFAHGLGGWPALRPALDAAGVAADVSAALAVGWQFGSAAMAAFAAIVLWTSARLWRGAGVDRVPARVVGLAYGGFGLVAFVARGFEPFFLMFVAVGGLVVAAMSGGRRS